MRLSSNHVPVQASALISSVSSFICYYESALARAHIERQGTNLLCRAAKWAIKGGGIGSRAFARCVGFMMGDAVMNEAVVSGRRSDERGSRIATSLLHFSP